jgi:hypothetical protein
MLSNLPFKVVPIELTVAAIRPYSSGSRLVVQKRSDFRHVTGSLLTLRWKVNESTF